MSEKKINKILLLNQPLQIIDVPSYSYLYPPNGLLSIYTYLKSKKDKLNCEILIRDFYDKREADLISEIEHIKPEIIGMGVLTPNYLYTIHLCDLIKEKFPDIKIILGGIHVSLHPEDTLSNKSVDYICIGEGEKALYDFIYAYNNNIPFKNVKSIGYKEYNLNNLTEFNTEFIDMNDIGELDYSSIDIDKYLEYAKRQSGYKAIGYVASRGCVYNCSFCVDGNHKSIIRKWRAVAPGLLIKYIKKWKIKYGIEGVWFKDSTFSFNKQWIKKFCQLLIEQKVDIKWSCNSRVDCIDEERIKLMSESGCETIWFGVESGSEKILKLLNKKINREKVVETFLLCQKYGVRAWANFMIGIPTETIEDIEKTFNFAVLLQKQSNVDNIHITIYTPFPGTPLYSKFHNDDFTMHLSSSDLNYDKACIDTGFVKKEVIKKIYDEMCIYFYKNRSHKLDFEKFKK